MDKTLRTEIEKVSSKDEEGNEVSVGENKIWKYTDKKTVAKMTAQNKKMIADNCKDQTCLDFKDSSYEVATKGVEQEWGSINYEQVLYSHHEITVGNYQLFFFNPSIEERKLKTS